MLDRKLIAEKLEECARRLATRGAEGLPLEEIVRLDRRRKELQHAFDEARNQQSQLGPRIQQAMKRGEEASDLKAQSAELKAAVREHEASLREVEAQLHELLLTVPNLPHPEAPLGGEDDGVVVRTEGEPKEFDFEPKDHVALCEASGLALLGERASKLAGASFVTFLGEGARLVRALINFFLDLHTREHGYTEVSPPFVANRETMTGTGQLPKFEEELYAIPRDGLYLIPTAEVPVTNLWRNEMIPGERLPLAYCAYTPCFRREAGAAGKMTRGLKRLHQFDKVELVRFCHPEASDEQHQLLLRHAEEPLRRLGLHYRIKELATGDLGFAAARCYDIEAHSPATGEWLEVSSVSTFTDFQARRANIRFKDPKAPGSKGKARKGFVHTLNGSGLALPRVIVALLETYQRPEGGAVVPEALRPYLDGRELLGA
ncbi:MAG: serine--tRNA ligase [Planctomycetota bacterium]|nr:MAG: serine--tRNA ligase [Planctomycetota bacterium]